MPSGNAGGGHRILAVNPGSTSTKLSLFLGETEVRAAAVSHSEAELSPCARIIDQLELRRRCLSAFLDEAGPVGRGLDAVVGRGGLLRPLPSGVYRVDDAMLRDLAEARYGEHASNLGAALAQEAARDSGCAAYIVDPVVVDELEDVARLSGIPEIERKSIFHALNQKSAAREVAAGLGKPYERCRFIVAHLGGGISVGAHLEGRVVDVNNALDGDGPLAPERSGGLPAGALVDIATDGKHARAELRRRITGGGGLVAYLGTNSLVRAREMAAGGDARAALVIEAMVYQVAQEISKHGATLRGRVDRIILTGGMAQDSALAAAIRDRVGHLAPVVVVPGEREMLSLARGALAVLEGRRAARCYGEGDRV